VAATEPTEKLRIEIGPTAGGGRFSSLGRPLRRGGQVSAVGTATPA
jgi:hypothetical protein